MQINEWEMNKMNEWEKEMLRRLLYIMSNKRKETTLGLQTIGPGPGPWKTKCEFLYSGDSSILIVALSFVVLSAALRKFYFG
jgi:hypothetical protein